MDTTQTVYITKSAYCRKWTLPKIYITENGTCACVCAAFRALCNPPPHHMKCLPIMHHTMVPAGRACLGGRVSSEALTQGRFAQHHMGQPDLIQAASFQVPYLLDDYRRF